MSAPQEWLWSDAWIFAAIRSCSAQAGAALTDIVAAADWLNHAIPVENEVEPALRKLLGAGLIKAADERFYLTAAGQAVEPPSRRGGPFDGWLSALSALPVSEQDWRLRPGELRAAVEAWNRRADVLIARPSRRRINRGQR